MPANSMGQNKAVDITMTTHDVSLEDMQGLDQKGIHGEGDRPPRQGSVASIEQEFDGTESALSSTQANASSIMNTAGDINENDDVALTSLAISNHSDTIPQDSHAAFTPNEETMLEAAIALVDRQTSKALKRSKSEAAVQGPPSEQIQEAANMILNAYAAYDNHDHDAFDDGFDGFDDDSHDGLDDASDEALGAPFQVTNVETGQTHTFQALPTSGEGYLCGAKSLQGSLREQSGINISEEWMTALVMTTSGGQACNFYVDQLGTAIASQFPGVTLRLVFFDVDSNQHQLVAEIDPSTNSSSQILYIATDYDGHNGSTHFCALRPVASASSGVHLGVDRVVCEAFEELLESTGESKDAKEGQGVSMDAAEKVEKVGEGDGKAEKQTDEDIDEEEHGQEGETEEVGEKEG